jgi:hypothetical protein
MQEARRLVQGNNEAMETITALTYTEFHREAAVRQRMAVVKKLRALEVKVSRYRFAQGHFFASRMGHFHLRQQLANNRPIPTFRTTFQREHP